MTKPAQEQTAGRKPVITPYRVMWSVMGSIAVVYLGVALFAPAWLGELLPSAAERQRDDMQPQIMKLSADVSGLRASLSRLQLDFDSARSDAIAQASATKSIDDRVAELEQKSRAAATPPVADATPPANAFGKGFAAVPPKLAAPEATVAMGSDATPAPAPLPPTKFVNPGAVNAGTVNPGASAMPSIVTGSIEGKAETPPPAAAKAADTAISFGPAVVKPAAKPVGIQIATDVSVDGLRARWTELSATHVELLKKLGARYAPGNDSANPNYNLVAGPIKSRAEAKKICKDLEAHDVLCKVAEFKGDTL